MNVDFTKLQVSMELKAENFQEVNIAKQLGNIVFSSQSTIEAFRLANKIYDSEEVDYTQEEVAIISQIVNNSDIALPFKRAILEAIGEPLQ